MTAVKQYGVSSIFFGLIGVVFVLPLSLVAQFQNMEWTLLVAGALIIIVMVKIT